MELEASDNNVVTRWQAEEDLAAVERRFGAMFDSPCYHQALRDALQPNPAKQLASFASVSGDTQRLIVDTIYARLAEYGQLPRSSAHEAKDAITRHLSALPGLDRKVTRKILALPPRRNLWTVLAHFVSHLRGGETT